MRLVEIEVRGYRSLFQGDEGHFKLSFTEGVNAIVGPNNVGKSNILRALSLALDPDFEFDRVRDMPANWAWSKPTVTLTFQVAERAVPHREQTLLRRMREYEQAVEPGRSSYFVDNREVKLRATIEGGHDSVGVRRRAFVTKGAGARDLGDDHPIAVKAINQFDACVRFVLVQSGQSLESLLQGRFRDVLQAILQAELVTEYDAAGASRQEYVEALQDGLLATLRSRLSQELQDLFPEVSHVALEPSVRNLEDTLTGMQINVSDTAITGLADKGTGVRGGLIVGMLQYLAAATRRSIVFAVEEPESFLHPAAQEGLRHDLEELARNPNVSFLMTTHSPYVISRQPDAQAISVAKTAEGRTYVHEIAGGSEPMGPSIAGLFRSSLISNFLDQASRTVEGERAIVVVEGETDRSWLRLAASRAGREDLLDDLTIYAAGDGGSFGGGADLAVMEAMVLHSTSVNPVAVLLDNDDDGINARQILERVNSKTKQWADGRRVFSYRHVFQPGNKHFAYEAEDLWPDELHEEFLAKHPNSLSEKVARPKPEGGFHYGYHSHAKKDLAVFFEQRVESKHCDRWIELLGLMRKGLDI